MNPVVSLYTSTLPCPCILILRLLTFVFDLMMLFTREGNFQFSLSFRAPSYCFPFTFVLFYFILFSY
ncbi:hypothetical protein I7I48_08418 [Histoplasma ohiense]|nr:hypothetical protein I7I48_08418 [Histoplasma ohiense (nom. inval.)]